MQAIKLTAAELGNIRRQAPDSAFDRGSGTFYDGQSLICSDAVAAQIAAASRTLPLALVKSDAIAALRAVCASQIVNGFLSSALGSPMTYPADTVSQQNLAGAIAASLASGLPTDWSTPFWCESGGAWALHPHTAAQIQAVGVDARAAVAACQRHLADLTNQVNAATTAAAVAVVAW